MFTYICERLRTLAHMVPFSLKSLKSLKGLRSFELWVMHRELHYFRAVLLISAFF